MSWKSSVAAPFLLVLPFLTSCVVPIAAPAPVANNAKKARYLAELEPPSQYNHPYDGLVGERVMPVARTLRFNGCFAFERRRSGGRSLRLGERRHLLYYFTGR